jgi:hypothetical protein
MDLRNAGGSPTVDVPSPSADRPSWTKVGVMAAIGFVVGVAWPRLSGVRLGPSVPEGPSASVSSAGSSGPGAPSAASTEPVAALAATPSEAVAPPVAPAAGSVIATPSHGTVFACKSADGGSLHASDCDALPGLDRIVMARLRKLADCPAAAGVNGTLHFVARVDFDRGVPVELGHARGTAPPEGLLACAKTAIAGVSIAGLAHDKSRYSVAYSVAFAAAAAPAVPVAPEAGSAAASPRAAHDVAAQTAEVEWEAAIVRDEPKTGNIVARLPRGTALRVGPVKDGWYPIKYGDGFASDGWVYRGAIGR